MADDISPALVLDMIPYSERDLVLTILTEKHGVVSAMARSARGSKMRYGGALDLFVVFAAKLRLKPPDRLSSLVGAEPTRVFPGILEDLTRLETGQAMLAMTRDLLRDAPAGPESFAAVVQSLERLDECPPGSAHAVLAGLCMDILDQMGHAPKTANCPTCGGAFREKGGAFLVADGVVLCEECADGRRGEPVRLDVLEAVGGLDRFDQAPSRVETMAFLARLLSNVLGRDYGIRLAVGGAEEKAGGPPG